MISISKLLEIIMSFILGCNFWASNAGTEMWKNFDAHVIEKDLRILKEHGIDYLRVFPIWRDFQPVTPLITAQGRISEYAQNGNEPENKYYLDEEMLNKFSVFLDICDKMQIKVIIGLITGWMSGALFVPTAFYGKNLITDPLCQYFEQLFIKGFIEKFKDRDAIYAWDLGNECNGMSPVNSRYEAASWAAMISNAIRAADSTRPVVSGMHGLDMTKKWTIADQGEFTDILTTHPYPFWCEHTRIDKTLSFRTTLLPTAQGKYYSDIGGRPCLTEEIGTMGPMICSDKLSADFLRVNLFSLWANGSEGAMWWSSPQSWSPILSPLPVPTESSPWTCTQIRSRASSIFLWIIFTAVRFSINILKKWSMTISLSYLPISALFPGQETLQPSSTAAWQSLISAAPRLTR